MIFIAKQIIPKNFIGITLFPFIFLQNNELKNNKTVINHEKIHLQQQLELLVLFFYFFYGLEYIIKLIQYKNKNIAYRNLSFEREAYTNEKNLSYLKKRKPWSFIKYI